MQLTDLPEEIIVMIIRTLDFYSQNSLYNTCTTLRNIVCMHGVIKECNMSLNVMASVNSLQLDFFKDISNHLLELNLCGVPDLYKTKVMPAFKKLKHLTTLDISYTNLNISDLFEIYSACPTLKDITVNFKFGQPTIITIPEETLLQCQSLFEHLENVHFVGSFNNLLSSDIVLHVLKKSKLNNLKLSVVEQDDVGTTIRNQFSDCKLPQFRHLAIYLINWREFNTSHANLTRFPVLSMNDYGNFECLLIYRLTVDVVVYSTPIFKKFFLENFDINVECISDYKSNLMGNIAIMFWNQNTTHFDDHFFQELYKHIRHYFPFMCKSVPNVSCPQKYNWVHMVPGPKVVVKDENQYLFRIKKRRMSIPKLVLNYDSLLKEKLQVQLNIIFNANKSVTATLTRNCEYLRKITFLSLSGSCVYYSSDFFNVLFRYASNLVTLNVESPQLSPCASAILRGIPLSQSMKNLRLTDKGIDFKTLFDAFTQCPTLANIHLLDRRQWDHSQVADPSLLIQNCVNLYCIFMEAPFTEAAHTKQMQLFNKAKTKYGKPHLKVVINQVSNNNPFRYNYSPYVDVFQLNPIKPI